MKIYNKIVFDMSTMDVISEDSFEYSGPVALCGGSGGGGEVDKEYNARMATVFESQNEMATGLYNFYRYGTFEAPEIAASGGGSGGGSGGDLSTWTKLDKNPVTGNTEDMYQNPDTGKWMTLEAANQYIKDNPSKNTTNVSAAQQGSGPNGQMTVWDYAHGPTSMANMELQQTAANMQLTPLQFALARDQLKQDRAMLPKVGEAKLAAFDLAMLNNDKTAMGEASAEVVQAFKNRKDQLSDDIRRTGARPGSNAAMLQDLRFDQTKALAGARTAARNTSRATRYTQLSDFYKTAIT